jgi:HSP90 family molecular chaperone
MIDNLGTIAKSGTQSFLKAMDSNKGNTDSLIGQFGVGFYSSFMAGDKIEVISRTQDANKASLWVSDGTVFIIVKKLIGRISSFRCRKL